MKKYLWFFCFLMLSCQSSPVKQFSKLHDGMEKTEVLDIMGPPRTVTRMHGKDRWIYVYYDNEVRQEKEVHFQDGKAVYVGDSWKPTPDQTAESKDKKNEELEKIASEESKKRQTERQDSQQKFEESVKGEKNIKYMPEFVELK